MQIVRFQEITLLLKDEVEILLLITTVQMEQALSLKNKMLLTILLLRRTI